jgi:hypothetical protein
MIETLVEFARIGLEIIGIAAVVAAATPNTVDDNLLAKARSVLDFIACNFGNAKNQ